MRKFIAFAIALSMIISCAFLVNADDITGSVNAELSFVEIVIDGETVVVPAIVESNQSSRSTYSIGNDQQVCEESVTIYVPKSDDAKEYNENFVNQAKRNAKTRSTTTDEFIDANNYVTVTTYIRYTISGAYCDGEWVSDFMVKIDNVAITKDKNADGSYLLGISSPTAYVLLVGGDVVAGGPYYQDATLSLGWSSTGTNTPSTWSPVVRGAYSDLYRGFSRFDFSLLYQTSSGQQTVNCSFEQTLAK